MNSTMRFPFLKFAFEPFCEKAINVVLKWNVFFSWAYNVFKPINVGAQWLTDRVLDSRPRGRVFKRHCVVVLEQDTFILA